MTIALTAVFLLLPLYSQTSRALLWVQTSGTDFDSGTKVKVDTQSSPGNVTLTYSWGKSPMNPVLDVSLPGEWDDYSVFAPSVLHEGPLYRMWYTGSDGMLDRIGYAESMDGVLWIRPGMMPVLDIGMPGSWDDRGVGHPSVVRTPTTLVMYYTGYGAARSAIGVATSVDGISWSRPWPTPVLDRGTALTWDSEYVRHPAVSYDGLRFNMWYVGSDGSTQRIGHAQSPDGFNWMKTPGNPVLDVGPPGSWDDTNLGDAGVADSRGALQMAYTGCNLLNCRIGSALSLTGINWMRQEMVPVLDLGPPGAWDDTHVQDPSVLTDLPSFKMWYTGNDGAVSRIGLVDQSFVSLGTFTSAVFDAGLNGTSWNSISWVETLPAGTDITMAARSGHSAVPDSSWSPWTVETTDETGSALSLPRSRYFQYRANLTTVFSYSTPVLEEVRLDYSPNTASPPTLSSPPDGNVTANDRPTFIWIYGDPEGDPQIGYTIQLDDSSAFGSIDYTSGDVNSATQSWTPSAPISTGTWFWRARTRDLYGVWSGYSSHWTIHIDKAGPIVTIVSPSDGSHVNTTFIDVRGTATDMGMAGIESVDVRANGGPWQQALGTTSWNATVNLVPGSNPIDVRAWDNLGNPSSIESISVIFDSIQPTVAITSPIGGSAFNTTPIAVAGTAADTGPGSLERVDVRVNGGAWSLASGTSTWTLMVALSSGPNVIEAQSWDMAGNPSSIASITVTYNAPPVPSFIVNPSSGNVTTVFTVDASSSSDAEDSSGSLLVRWDWEDDGVWDTGWSTTKTAQHSYAQIGAFTIRLEVRDTGGEARTTTQQVFIANTPPTASFIIAPPTGTIQTTFSFDSSTSSDLEDATAVLEVRWDWQDDGTWDTSWTTVKTAAHQYSQIGTYTVRLGARDTSGATDTSTQTVSVLNTAPTASFTVAPASGTISTTFSVDAGGSSDLEDPVAALQIRWDWEDDGTWDTPWSTTKTASHQYPSQGLKIIRLAVSDTMGLTATATRTVTVGNTPPTPSLVVTPREGGITTQFTADASGSTDAESAAVALEVRWDWENDAIWDTTWSTSKSAQHQYSTYGSRTIRVEVRDTGGLTSTVAIVVWVNNTSPTAAFSIAQIPAYQMPLTVDVNASGSADPDESASLLEVRWDWEDDGYWDTNWAVTMSAQHSYSLPGTFTVRLEVRDSGGLASTYTRQVQVVDSVPPVITSITHPDIGINEVATIDVVVTDDVAVSEVILNYKGVGDTGYTGVTMSYIGNDTYTANLPAQPQQGSVSYYINATDVGGNVARNPVTNEHVFGVVVKGNPLDVNPLLLAGIVLAVVAFVGLVIFFTILHRKEEE